MVSDLVVTAHRHSTSFSTRIYTKLLTLSLSPLTLKINQRRLQTQLLSYQQTRSSQGGDCARDLPDSRCAKRSQAHLHSPSKNHFIIFFLQPILLSPSQLQNGIHSGGPIQVSSQAEIHRRGGRATTTCTTPRSAGRRPGTTRRNTDRSPGW